MSLLSWLFGAEEKEEYRPRHEDRHPENIKSQNITFAHVPKEDGADKLLTFSKVPLSQKDEVLERALAYASSCPYSAAADPNFESVYQEMRVKS